ncbi:MAG: hypothetical protein JWQ34_3737 [Mucilaginibacter sp.]|nr:hypothetical protein [Mucilaginibacter sp.]
MKKYLLSILIVIVVYHSVSAQYQRSKTETIDFINNLLKFREETRIYESDPISKVNNLIVLQHLDDETCKQVKQTIDNKRLTTIINKIHWDAFRAFGYNDNRSELYIYFNTNIRVNNTPKDVFGIYIPDDKVEEMKNAILRLVAIFKTEK